MSTDADMRALLTAVHAALDIPMPSLDDPDERAHYRILAQRAGVARIALASVLGHGLPDAAGWLTSLIAEMPVTYQVWAPAKQQDTEGQS